MAPGLQIHSRDSFVQAGATACGNSQYSGVDAT